MTAASAGTAVLPPARPGEVEPLAGFTVAVTASRRREELSSLLERRGARVVQAPAIRIVPLADDTELLTATRAVLAAPLDFAVATTGIGFRGWMEAADGWGLGELLSRRLGGAALLARGPKARGAIRAVGLVDTWSPPSESSSEVLAYLLGQELAGRRVAVQLHGEPLPDFVQALRAAGACVVEVPVYRWAPPDDTALLGRLVEAVAAHAVDAVTFTSAPAAASLLRAADRAGLLPDVVDAFRRRVLAACVGPVTAGPLDRLDVPSMQPARARLGALVRQLCLTLPGRVRRLPVAGRTLEVRGHAAVVDGVLRPLAPAPAAALRVLAEQPGRVCSRAELLGALPGQGADEHAVEMTVNRLRTALEAPLVQTIGMRGYRLAYEPENAGPGCLDRPGAS
ncbi:MAG: uroporphyrinogen-III synthase [Gemmatimonadota bacterium]